MTDTLYIPLLDSLILSLSTVPPSEATLVPLEETSNSFLVIGLAILQALLTGGLLALLGLWIKKKLANHDITLKKGLADYDSALKENLAGFTLLNELQVEAFGKFYSLLFDLWATIRIVHQQAKRNGYSARKEGEYGAIIRPPIKEIKEWSRKHKALSVYYSRHRYLFPESLRNDVQPLFTSIKTAYTPFKKLHQIDKTFQYDKHNVEVDRENSQEADDLRIQLNRQVDSYDFEASLETIQPHVKTVLESIDKEFDRFRFR